MTEPLTEAAVIAYVRQAAWGKGLFEPQDTLTATQITEGNVNLLFRVAAEEDPVRRSVLVKQALPYAWRYPDFKMPVDRQRIENGVLSLEAQYCPDLVPRIYAYDQEEHIIVMEDLNRHAMMREGLIAQTRYPLVAKHIGTFMARTLFFTSDLYLTSAEKKALVPQYINPVLCKVQEDLVFTEPFMEHANNRYSTPLAPLVARIYADDELRSEVFTLKERYLTHAQALIHNDLHTGSILLSQQETKVIDPEFAFFGPMGHDIGTYLGNMALAYAAQEAHASESRTRTAYRAWIVDSMRETWEVFASEFRSLWENKGNDQWPSPTFRADYLRRLLQDTAGFGGTEMFRRLIGMAHVHDFWTIKDEKMRAKAESLGIYIATRWLKQRAAFNSIDDLLEIVRTSIPHPDI